MRAATRSTDDPVSDSTGGSRRTGPDLDRLAELEEERRFLLDSLRDLEREHDVGDVDDADYATLRDGYTARAAAVLRQVEQGRAALPGRPPRRWGRAVFVAAAVVVAAVGIGLVLAGAWGERGAGQEITGFTPADDARTVLASARSALNEGELELANSLYGRVIEMERERGVDNAEAITYFGWTLALLTRTDPDGARADELLDASRLALAQAIEIEPDYADPHCFLAIVEFEFRGDAEAALVPAETCESSNPPADIAAIVTPFVEEIRTAID